MIQTQSDFAGGGAGCDSPSQPPFTAPLPGLSGAKMNDLTWRKHYRKVWDNPMVTMTGWLPVWIWLLDHATHNGWDVMWKGERITLKPGQLTCGRNQIAKATGVCPPQVQRVMSVLQRDNQIIIQTSSVCSLISIVNWEKYQSKYQGKYQQNISGLSAEYQPRITKQEGNNDIRKRSNTDIDKDIEASIASSIAKHNCLQCSDFITAFRAWIDYRKELKKPLRHATLMLQASKLAKMGKDAAIASINQSIEHGWTGLFEATTPTGKPIRQRQEDLI